MLPCWLAALIILVALLDLCHSTKGQMSHLSVPTLPTDSPVCKDSSLAWEGHKACRTGVLFVLSMQLFCYCTCRSAPLNHVLRVDLSAIQGVNYNNKDITGRADKSTNPHAHAIAILETQLTERLHETSMKIKMESIKSNTLAKA